MTSVAAHLGVIVNGGLSRMDQVGNTVPGNLLIVEDEKLLAMMLEDLLLDAGHRVVHAGSVTDALALVEHQQFDAAILDVNIGGQEVFPVAVRLRELQTPFVFASASDADRMSPDFSAEQLISKPYTIVQLQQSLERMLSTRQH